MGQLLHPGWTLESSRDTTGWLSPHGGPRGHQQLAAVLPAPGLAGGFRGWRPDCAQWQAAEAGAAAACTPGLP